MLNVFNKKQSNHTGCIGIEKLYYIIVIYYIIIIVIVCLEQMKDRAHEKRRNIGIAIRKLLAMCFQLHKTVVLFLIFCHSVTMMDARIKHDQNAK